jgi:hypothetical protein
MDECRKAVHNKPPKELSLLDLLYKSRQCASTDPRDKIYGLYPLVNAKFALPRPDYDRSIVNIYKETAAYFLRSTGSLAVLSCAGVENYTSSRTSDLPSWVPDWSQEKAVSLAMFLDSAIPVASKASIIVSEDLSILSLRGKMVDEIVSLSQTIMPLLDPSRGEIDDWIVRAGSDSMIRLETSNEHVRVFDIFHDPVLSGELDTSRLPASSFIKSWLMSAKNVAVNILYGRCAFRSGTGKLGLAPSHAKLGDMIVLFEGGSVPYVIRPEGDVYKLVGEALVAGYIEGYYFFNHSDVRTITLI